MENGKLILDACCGSRMFWFDKHNPLALFVDKRSEIVTAKVKGNLALKNALLLFLQIYQQMAVGINMICRFPGGRGIKVRQK